MVFINIYYEDKNIKLIQGECLEVMDKLIEQGVKVDAIITDPPYGTTQCKWDEVIPFDCMWDRLDKLSLDTTPIVLFGSEPFSSKLRISNVQKFKYDWIWEKSNPTGMGQANRRPMKYHEMISIFYEKQCLYNKQMIPRESPRIKQAHDTGYEFNVSSTMTGNQQSIDYKNIKATRYDANLKNPSSIIKVNSLRANSKEWNKHPTQKPLTLLEYLINTYTNAGDIMLDFTCGSGTTLVAAKKLGRKAIGIELEEEYCEITKNRILEMAI